MSALLVVEDLRVSFDGVHALDGVSLHVAQSELVGLIGPNGAGKTTLLDCVSGFVRPAAGRVLLDGRDLAAVSPSGRASLGVGRSFQSVRMIPAATALENVLAARRRFFRSRLAPVALGLPAAGDEEARNRGVAERALELVGLAPYAAREARDLSFGMLRLLELAAVVALEPRLLLLDEPSSGLSGKETEALVPVLRRLLAGSAAAALLVEHDMGLVEALCDRVVALEAGRVVAEGLPRTVLRTVAVVPEHPDTVPGVTARRERPPEEGTTMDLEELTRARGMRPPSRVRSRWRSVAGWACLAGSLLAVFLTWYGVRDEAFLALQVPYLVSGGGAAIVLAVAAAVLLVGEDLRQTRRRLEELERRVASADERPEVGPPNDGVTPRGAASARARRR